MTAAAKRCTSCREELPLGAFNRAASSPDGRAPTCRRCASLARRGAKKPRQTNAIRAAIKHGDLAQVKTLFAGAREPVGKLLHMAVQDYSTARKNSGHVQIVDFLIARGATPHWSMLFEPARTGSQEIVDRLLAGGAERNLFACAAIGEVAAARTILKRQPELATARALLDMRSYRDFTALHFCCLSALGRNAPAIERQLLEMGKLLVENGADVNAPAHFYGTLTVSPLDMAAHTGSITPLIEFLIGRGATITSFGFLEALSHRGRSLDEGLALAELFLRHGFAINSPHDEGTVLHRAANSGGADVVEWLLAHGADVHARGRMGRTALHLAAERNRSPRVVQILLEHGARLDARDDGGLTPLDVARQFNRAALLPWLQT